MKKIRSILSLTLVVALLLSFSAMAIALAPVTELTPVKPSIAFTDVKTSDWYYENMDILVRSGGINGYADGTFKSGVNLKLSEFIKILVALIYPEQTSDWAELEIGGKVRWYSQYVGAAAEAGLLNNVDYSYDALEAQVSRYTMAVIMTNAAEAMYMPLEDSPSISYIIYDYKSIPDTYKPYVRRAYNEGILTGKDSKGSFSGSAGLTRAEACTAIVRLFDVDKRVMSTYYYNDFASNTVAVKAPYDWFYICDYYEDYDNDKDYWMNFVCAAADDGVYNGLVFSVMFSKFEWETDSQFVYVGKESGLNIYMYYPDELQYNPFNAAAEAIYARMKADLEAGRITIIVKYS